PCSAVSPANGREAACSNETFGGLMTSDRSEGHAYSAREPRQVPNTSSPGLNCVTFLPTASTWPATSRPSRVSLGLRNPKIKRLSHASRIMYASSALSEAARTLISTCSSVGTGFSTSSNLRTSGEPYSQKRMAFIGLTKAVLRSQSLVDLQ